MKSEAKLSATSTMLNKDIKEWLSEYKRLPPNEIHTFACTLASNENLIIALFDLFETPPFQVQQLDPVCHQLYDFYRSKEKPLQTFALQYVPTLIWLYLSSISRGNKKVCGGVETVLLGVYNLEIVQADGSPLVETFRIPVFGKPSIYHDARGAGMGMESLTESALRQLNHSHGVWKGGPFPSHEHFNAQNRFSILAVVMQHYNRQIDVFHHSSLLAVCKAVTNIVNSGFGTREWSSLPRITVHPSLLVEMLAAVFFSMFNDHQQMAVQAIQATHNRAGYELFSDLLLMTSGLLNSIQNGNFRMKKDDTGTVAIKLQSVKKSSITNASFKAKKLPDDIEFMEEDENGKLATVDEDGEHSMAKNIKAKLMNIGGKLGGDRNKNKDTTPRRDSDAMSQKSGGGSSDVMDNLSVAVVKGNSNSGKAVVVDVLEMQPMKSKSSKHHHEEPGIEHLDGELGLEHLTLSRRNHDNEGKPSSKHSSASLVFSKKLGFSKSHSTAGSPSSAGGANTAANHSSHGPSRKSLPLSAVEAKPSISTLPEIITSSATSTSTNGLSSSSSGISSSSSVIPTSPRGRLVGNQFTNPRASSEGRTLEGSASSFGFMSTSSKQSRIATSISESNLPPASDSSTSASSNSHPSSQSSYSVASEMGAGSGHRAKQDKNGTASSNSGSHVNPSSVSTDL